MTVMWSVAFNHYDLCYIKSMSLAVHLVIITKRELVQKAKKSFRDYMLILFIVIVF